MNQPRAGTSNRDHHERAAARAGWTDPRIGAVVHDRYRVVEHVADGAMGVVYRAEALRLDRPVAIKFLHTELADDETLRARFRREAWALAQVNHPGCVSVLDFGICDVPYLVMEYVEGRNLRTEIAGPMPPGRALHIIRQVLAALAHVHALGIIHRDIKPDNIVLESVAGFDDHVRLLDFGLARLVGTPSTLTAGLALGTPNYMAPEQTGRGEISVATDVYAAGVLLFELLTGCKPFDGRDLGEVLLKQLEDETPRLQEVAGPGVFSSGLEAAIHRAMAREPQSRFVSIEAMLQAVNATPEAQAPREAPARRAAETARPLHQDLDPTLPDPPRWAPNVHAPASVPPGAHRHVLPGIEAMARQPTSRSGWLVAALLAAAFALAWRYWA